MYTLTDYGKSCLDQGLVELKDEDECLESEIYVKSFFSDVQFMGILNSHREDRPKGCFVRASDQDISRTSIYWNTHHKGKRHQMSKSVCKHGMYFSKAYGHSIK